MTDLLGSEIGGSEKYPTVVNESGGTFFCRNVIAIHLFMNLSGGTFDRFLMIAASTLQTHGVSKADIGAIGDALSSSRGDIVDPLYAEAGVRSADAAIGF
jgi:hypothetical protein